MSRPDMETIKAWFHNEMQEACAICNEPLSPDDDHRECDERQRVEEAELQDHYLRPWQSDRAYADTLVRWCGVGEETEGC